METIYNVARNVETINNVARYVETINNVARNVETIYNLARNVETTYHATTVVTLRRMRNVKQIQYRPVITTRGMEAVHK